MLYNFFEIYEKVQFIFFAFKIVSIAVLRFEFN